MRKILKNDFNRNVLTLLTGTSFAQAVPIAISPILTRMYTPADFGIYAIFVSITAIFGSIATGKYELALVVPESDKDAINIASLSLLISSIFSGFLLLLVILFNSSITKLLGNDEISPWLYVAPLFIFLIALFQILNYLNTRFKNYADISRANIYKSFVVAFFQLVLGYFKIGAGGLITGQIFSNVAGNTKLIKNILKEKSLIKAISFKEMKRLGKEYNEYPKYTMWGTLAVTLSQNVTNIFISSVYSIATLGFYSLVHRILAVPTQLIGKSIGQVYFQKASEEKNKKGNAQSTFDSTLKKLLLISLPGFTLLFFLVKDIMIFVFGSDWAVAGNYARILIPLFCIRFIVTPLSITAPLFKQNKFGLKWQVGLLIISIVLFIITKYNNITITNFLYIYTTVLSLYYVYYFYKLRKFSRIFSTDVDHKKGSDSPN